MLLDKLVIPVVFISDLIRGPVRVGVKKNEKMKE